MSLGTPENSAIQKLFIYLLLFINVYVCSLVPGLLSSTLPGCNLPAAHEDFEHAHACLMRPALLSSTLQCYNLPAGHEVAGH